MGAKVLRPSGRKDWYIQVCEGGQRYLRHVGTREAAFDAKREIDAARAAGTFRAPEKNQVKTITRGRWRLSRSESGVETGAHPQDGKSRG